MTLTPWLVDGNIDYKKIVEKFGTQLIDNELIKRFEKVTGHKAHPWLERGIFFSHRDLDKLLDAKEKDEIIYIYTGRGPSSESLHLGHFIPFTFTAWLQKVFNCIVVIQIADEEKYFFKNNMTFDEIYKLGFENAKDIITFDFNPDKTFIFSNRDYRLSTPEYEKFVSEMMKNTSSKEIAKIFGFGKENDNKEYIYDENINIGSFTWPLYQAAPSFSNSFPHIFNNKFAHCLVAYAIDQDPYFRLARDLASKFKLKKPYSLMSIFLPSLTGLEKGKMSSSYNSNTTIYLTDTENLIRKKVMKYCFSGGGGNGSLDDHRKYGGNINSDIAFQYLNFFEFNNDNLDKIKNDFSSGKMSCSEIKKIMSDKLVEIILNYQEKRKLITDDILLNYYKKK